MLRSRDSGWWYAMGAGALGIFVVALLVSLTLWLAGDDLSKADQAASVVSLLVGTASLVVSVASLIQAARQRTTAQGVRSTEGAFAEELNGLLGRAGGLSVRDIAAELRRTRPNLSTRAGRSLPAVLRGRQRPTWELVEAIVTICVGHAERREIPLSAQDHDVQRWRRRYDELFGEARPGRGRLVVAGAAALVVLVVVSVAVVLYDGDGDRRATNTTNTDAASPGATVSGAPSGAEGPESAEAPFTTSAEYFPDLCEGGYLVPRPLSQMPALPAPINGDWPGWAADLNALPARLTFLQFTVRGRSEAAVVLTGVRIRATQRKAPPAGVLARATCGDPSVFRWFAVDLDVDPPRVTTAHNPELADPNGPLQQREAVRFPYQVSINDPESFQVFASTRECDCVWQVELLWSDGERHGVHIVQADGKPAQFRTVGTVNARTMCFDTLDNCGPVKD